jgi:hypothetical protein
MNKHKNMEQSRKAEQSMIVEMIDASWELAERIGKHALKSGCSCISCVNKRKRLLKRLEQEWKFSL